MGRVPSDSHWQQVYEKRAPDQVSWFEPVPELSLALIEASGLPKDAGLLDAGGGASGLAGELVGAGYSDVTVTDLSGAALEQAQAEIGAGADEIEWVVADIRDHDFGRRFDLWHDRAVFHFMVEETDREAYLAVLGRSLRPGGHLIIATFGPEGPTECSGLPVRRYDADDLAAQLGVEFELLDTRPAAHSTPSGKQQQFLYAHFRRRD
jgi:SAM-dependent methyltransferase